MVNAPSSKIILEFPSCGRGLKFRYRPDPAGSAHQLALAYSLERAIVGQKVQQGLRRVSRQKAADRLVQVQFPALHRPIRKNRRMKMAMNTGALREETDERR